MTEVKPTETLRVPEDGGFAGVRLSQSCAVNEIYTRAKCGGPDAPPYSDRNLTMKGSVL